MATPGRVFRDLKKFRDRVTHEVPTGPHTDVKKRKIIPSFKKKLTGIGAGTKGGFGAAKRRRAKHNIGGITKILRRLGKEIKKQPLPKKTKDLNKKFKKAFPHHDSAGKLKKAGGGRAIYKSGGAVLKGKKVGCQIK